MVDGREPGRPARWYQTGPAIFVYVIVTAASLAYCTHDGENGSYRHQLVGPRDIDEACLETIDDDTALLFDSDIEEGRLKACDRSTDDIVLPPELESALDDVTGEGGDTFHGYDCLGDCSGHLAGYEWAARHDIDDAASCGGKSQSFIEGCMAYAEDQ